MGEQNAINTLQCNYVISDLSSQGIGRNENKDPLKDRLSKKKKKIDSLGDFDQFRMCSGSGERERKICS